MKHKYRRLYFPLSAALILTLILYLPVLEFAVPFSYICMLFLPLLDRDWKLPHLWTYRSRIELHLLLALILSCAAVIILSDGLEQEPLFMMLILVLAEEWFFRAYLQERLGQDIRAVIIVSIVFAIMHVPVVGMLHGAMVFIPSILYGWVYLKMRNIYLVIVLHLISNLIYIEWLAPVVQVW